MKALIILILSVVPAVAPPLPVNLARDLGLYDLVDIEDRRGIDPIAALEIKWLQHKANFTRVHACLIFREITESDRKEPCE